MIFENTAFGHVTKVPNLILHIRINLGTKFQFKLTILNFRPNFPENDISGRKQEPWTGNVEYQNLRIQISLGAKFYFKEAILNFGTKFTHKECFRSKMEKVSIAIDLYTFEVV